MAYSPIHPHEVKVKNDTMELQIKFVDEVISSCFLPKTTINIEDTMLRPSDFDEHRKLLDFKLTILCPVIREDDNWLLSQHSEQAVITKGKLIMLLCEITAPNTVYKIRSEQFLKSLDDYIEQYIHPLIESTEGVEEYLFEHYSNYLHRDSWKKRLGPVHGYQRFLELRTAREWKLKNRWMNLTLSAAVNLHESHLTRYKELSTTLFHIILRHSDPEELTALNIPSVIFNNVLKNLRPAESVESISAGWECLCDCLSFHLDSDAPDSWDWDATDELMEALFFNLKYTSDIKITLCLISFIPRVLLRSSTNRKEIENFLLATHSSLTDEELAEFRLECCKISSRASYRWVVQLLKFFVREHQRFVSGSKTCRKMLWQFHMCYLTSVYIIPVEVINLNLARFYKKFSNIIVDILRMFKHSARVRKLVQSIFETFADHLERSELEGDFKTFHTAFRSFDADNP